MPPIRNHSHAAGEKYGAWYQSNPNKLDQELESYLAKVPDTDIKGIASRAGEPGAQFPVEGARGIIAPHAGYTFSGPTAAWAYKSLDWSKAKRIFLLGPAHIHVGKWPVYLSRETSIRVALSACEAYSTPFGNLQLDLATIAELRETGNFVNLTQKEDEQEHSLEMHLPYIYKVLSKAFSDGPSTFPLLTPILVGSNSPSVEQSLGKLLSKYISDPSTFWVISSDFCHWGSRFSYTYYDPKPFDPSTWVPSQKSSTAVNIESPRVDKNTPATDYVPNPPIFESIHSADMAAIYSIETKGYAGFIAELARTRNTVCGRHPIGVMMAGLEATYQNDKDSVGNFTFVRLATSSNVRTVDSEVLTALGYERYGKEKLKEAGIVLTESGHFGSTSAVHEETGEEISDSSVSYASAYAIF